jgi:hypothetical protein
MALRLPRTTRPRPLRSATIFAAFLSLAALPLVAAARTPPPRPLALTHVTVIDATGAAAQPNMTVITAGRRIAALGKTGQVRVPKGAQIVDASGKYLIPGLWDMHVHFAEIERSFPLFVANGVTGVRNMGGNLDDLLRWRTEVDAGRLLGPRVILCGPILDGPQPAAQGPTIVVATTAEGRQAVDMLKKRGADCVKVYDRLPRDAYYAIVDEAARLGLPVVGHVPLALSAVEASDAGQRSIEHLGNILEGASTIEAELRRLESTAEVPSDPSEFPRRLAARGNRMLDTYDEQKAGKIFSQFLKNRTWQVPTLEFKWALTFIDAISQRDDSRLKYIPESERQWWSPEKNFFSRYRTPEYIVFKKRLFQKELDLVGAMHRAGVPFLAGTDVSGAYVFPGFSLHHELELYVQAGFSPLEALQAATRNPAVFLGESSSRGTVEPGKIADLVLLAGNPLTDIRNTQTIEAVVLSGRYLPKAALAKMLRGVEAAAKAK